MLWDEWLTIQQNRLEYHGPFSVGFAVNSIYIFLDPPSCREYRPWVAIK